MRARKATFSVLTIALLLGLTTNLGGCEIGGEGGEGDDVEQQAPGGDDEGEEEGDDD